MDLEITIICNVCGSTLDATQEHSYRGAPPQVCVEPCAKCLKRAKDDGREEGEDAS